MSRTPKWHFSVWLDSIQSVLHIESHCGEPLSNYLVCWHLIWELNLFPFSLLTLSWYNARCVINDAVIISLKMDHPRPLFRSVYSITKNTILPQIQNKTFTIWCQDCNYLNHWTVSSNIFHYNLFFHFPNLCENLLSK